jgi:hypothetical protein
MQSENIVFRPAGRWRAWVACLFWLVPFTLAALLLPGLRQSAPAGSPARQQIYAETLKPYTGPSVRGVDVSTLTGKVLCGYQGWFTAEGDGARRGWGHWTKRNNAPPGPGNLNVDLWPDVSELTAEERFPTALKLANGRTAEVFSSFKKPTVLRHFRWMRDYGIDGAFVQRFAVEIEHTPGLRHFNTVLDHCREGANVNGRTYAVMYDLTGLRAQRIAGVMEDWRLLRTRMKLTDDPAYLRHRGRPVVAVWGIGFRDKNRHYTLEECRRLVEFLKHDKEAGGCTVMLGLPRGWREFEGDTVKDRALHELIRAADIVSPWTVGNYRTPREVARHTEKYWKADMAWCKPKGLDYMPVVYPGFSWHNLKGAPLDQIPREGGHFLWTQYYQARHAGATMVFQAMFDEVDEGTAIFKCTNDLPSGVKLLGLGGLPADHYLWLVGQASRMVRGEIPLRDKLPARK